MNKVKSLLYITILKFGIEYSSLSKDVKNKFCYVIDGKI